MLHAAPPPWGNILLPDLDPWAQLHTKGIYKVRKKQPLWSFSPHLSHSQAVISFCCLAMRSTGCVSWWPSWNYFSSPMKDGLVTAHWALLRHCGVTTRERTVEVNHTVTVQSHSSFDVCREWGGCFSTTTGCQSCGHSELNVTSPSGLIRSQWTKWQLAKCKELWSVP